jgi:D-beta-D-heptose 7-phosphate kinase/D-beta-D-heptose 1-phosphate adenosyltransferase
MQDEIQSKIFTLSSFQNVLDTWRKNGESIVFTNGVFDIVHKGHVDYLNKASHLAKHMILGLNSDSSVKRLEKGEDRPINKQEDRAYLVAAFGFIDAVIIFNEDTPIELIKNIQPNVLVKGGDYNPSAIKGDPKYIVGSDIVLESSGKIEVIPFLTGYSTTNLLKKIRNSDPGWQN